MKNYSIVGEFIKTQREKKGLTQTQVSKRLGYSTSQFVSNWERGLAAPPIEAAARLLEILSVPKKKMIHVFMRLERDAIERALK